jgi:hypothetical protein
MKMQFPGPFRGLFDGNSQTLFWQHMLYHIRPFDNDHNLRVARHFGQFVSHHTGLCQPVKIEVVYFELGCDV